MRGSIQFPPTCNQTVACPATFTLAPGPLSAAAIETALGAGSNGFFGQLINNALGNRISAWPTLQGQIRTESLALGHLALRDVAAALSVEGNKLTLTSLDATALGGTLHGSGEMAFENNTPHWKLSLRVAGAKASETAAVFGEQWGSGVMSGETNLTMAGYSTEDLASSAAGDFSFSWQNGALAATPERKHRSPVHSIRSLDRERHHRRSGPHPRQWRNRARRQNNTYARQRYLRSRPEPYPRIAPRPRQNYRNPRPSQLRQSRHWEVISFW